MDDAVNEMTRQDIWDDSALINSWNEALAEYKVSTVQSLPNTEPNMQSLIIPSQKYHSIHAAGRSLDNFLPEYVPANPYLVSLEYLAEIVNAETSNMPSRKHTLTNLPSLPLDPWSMKQTKRSMAKGSPPIQPRIARPPR